MDGALAPIRTSKEVVDSVNKALGVRKTLAARKLDNRDTIVTFQKYALYYKVDNA
jgi:hypothetical protein